MSMPPLTVLSGKFGAPMGRMNVIDVDAEVFSSKVLLQRMPMQCLGDYDMGGAYWGCGSREHGYMYRCYFKDESTDEHIDMFIRATGRHHAKELVREELPKVMFYR